MTTTTAGHPVPHHRAGRSSRPMQARAERTRVEILSAAARMICRRGDFGVNDMLADARATKGAMYFHFASKDDLVLAVIDAAAATVRAHLAAATDERVLHPGEVVEVFLDCASADPMVAASCVLWNHPDHQAAARTGTRAPLWEAVTAALRSWYPDELADRTADLLTAVVTAHTAAPGTTPAGEDDRTRVTALVDHALTAGTPGTPPRPVMRLPHGGVFARARGDGGGQWQS